ncbi:protein-(glutamine-N5) methyltransferase, release factor-specific [Bdellovibrio bacteriovorus]|uniref:Release factor glutamine methyltransferase n=1 Tax=Bdellovibrio bacteriovorus TaxID=959 RepID=A0A150WQX4_BDEBC|nr:peptide chain release factor N(5)-glutamine methyltransferase [Bdellovibrio bacteriovorus]KYG66776.1 protein-(glutamine-N5) methyltransferase, release factor-specific [Bdellovibrio bacteriovorus]
MKLKEILDKTTQFFKDKGIETPRLDAELLLAHGLKLERIQLYLKFDQPMKEDELATLRELVRRRAQGEPVAYILGYREFYKYRFEVNNHVLIPRPETEHVIEEVLAWAKDQKSDLGLIDLGFGSGCIGLTLLKELPQAKLVAVDISAEASAVAKRNAESLGVQDRVRFVNADAANSDAVLTAYKELTGNDKIDVLVSNPPYIASDDPQVEANVKKFEPNLALFADDQGLALLKNWSKIYSSHLAAKACVVMEMGMTQGSVMKDYFSNFNVFSEVKVIKDLAGLDRLICGVKNG